MLFNSLEFLIFFPIVTAGYFLLPYQWRWLWLLVASCIFYMAFVPIYILILVVTIVVDYFAGLLIERTAGQGPAAGISSRASSSPAACCSCSSTSTSSAPT